MSYLAQCILYFFFLIVIQHHSRYGRHWIILVWQQSFRFFLESTAYFPLYQTQFHLSFLKGHIFYMPSASLSSLIPITCICLETTKIRHSTPTQDLTVLHREKTTPYVSHVTLLCFCVFCFFSSQFDSVGFYSVFLPVHLPDAILQKSCL